jgi:hypothetical protein
MQVFLLLNLILKRKNIFSMATEPSEQAEGKPGRIPS